MTDQDVRIAGGVVDRRSVESNAEVGSGEEGRRDAVSSKCCCRLPYDDLCP